jgi:hypothetical protein
MKLINIFKNLKAKQIAEVHVTVGILIDTFLLVYTLYINTHYQPNAQFFDKYFVVTPIAIAASIAQLLLLRSLKFYFQKGVIGFFKVIALSRIAIFAIFVNFLSIFPFLGIIVFAFMICAFIFDMIILFFVLNNSPDAHIGKITSKIISVLLVLLFIASVFLIPQKINSSKTKLQCVFGSDLAVSTLTKIYEEINIAVFDYELLAKTKIDSLAGRYTTNNGYLSSAKWPQFIRTYESGGYYHYPKIIIMNYQFVNSQRTGKITVKLRDDFFKEGSVTEVELNNYSINSSDSAAFKGSFNIICKGKDKKGRYKRTLEIKNLSVNAIANNDPDIENENNTPKNLYLSYSFSGNISITDKAPMEKYFAKDSSGMKYSQDQSYPFIYSIETALKGSYLNNDFSVKTSVPLAYREKGNIQSIYFGTMTVTSGSFTYDLDYEQDDRYITVNKDKIRMNNIYYQ